AIDPAHRAQFRPAAVERLLAWPATARRVQIWKALLRVPFGRTVSYGELARQVSPPSGARAVGQTMNKNPFPLIVPCHRVVQTGGALGGFGAGLDWKRALLAWEAQR
ncbi:MAG TPA: methylated-DNA--[protein]-cysteine S-methyltransferase, partial [Planctomycetota bacterium]|nr:methylated-DNA--[protein]-cysteine S-methyltransferase [Planctomycetota bacterium]